MAKELTPEELVKEALKEIYNLPRIDGIIVVGIVSEKGSYSIKGRIMGSPVTRMRMFAQTLYKSAGEFGLSPDELLTLLKGMMVEAKVANRAMDKKKPPKGSSSGSSFTITKM